MAPSKRMCSRNSNSSYDIFDRRRLLSQSCTSPCVPPRLYGNVCQRNKRRGDPNGCGEEHSADAGRNKFPPGRAFARTRCYGAQSPIESRLFQPVRAMSKLTSRGLGIDAAIFAGLAALSSWGNALSPPPPAPPTLEDHVRNADVIAVGEVVGFFFKGISNEVPDEYEQVFDAPGRSRNLYAIVRTTKTLQNDLKIEIPASMRIAAAFPVSDYESYRGRQLIFFLRKPYQSPSKSGTFQAFPLAAKPMDPQKLKEIQKLISATRRNSS